MSQKTIERKDKKIIVIGINDLSIGGAQNQLVRQLPFYNKDQFEIHIVLLFADNKRTNFIEQVPKHITVHELSFEGFLDLKSWIMLYRLMNSIQPNLVMSSLFFSNTVFRILKLFIGYPIISREHNTYIDKKKPKIWTDRVLSIWTKKIVAVSDEVAEFTSKQEKIKSDKFLVINNGINLEEIDETRLKLKTSDVRNALSIQREEKVLLSVGRLVSQKNLTIMIKGFARFKSKKTNWKLLIIGGGEQENHLKDLVKKLGMEQDIIFGGEQQDTSPYYAIADCLISTSLIEGMSNVQLKALAYGLPILATPTGGTGAIISNGETGYIIAKPTASCVAETIARFAESDSALMKRNALEHRKRFDIKRTVSQYEALFQQYAK